MGVLSTDSSLLAGVPFDKSLCSDFLLAFRVRMSLSGFCILRGTVYGSAKKPGLFQEEGSV